jgi:UDP-2,3-diacylglucosamine pyrophosphatase LpxH
MGKVIVATSDQHTDSAPPAVQASQLDFFRSLVNRADIECVVSVGDLWSMTLDSSVNTVLSNPHCAKVRDLIRELSKSKRVVLVEGNHDPYSALPAGDHQCFVNWLNAPGVELKPYLNYLFPGFPTMYFTHGSQFDPTTEIWKGVTDTLRAALGPAAAERLFQWAVGLYLKQKSGPTARQVRAFDSDVYEKTVSRMHEDMWKWTLDKRNQYQIIVMGHSHFDEHRHKELSDKTYVNCGAFDGFGSSYVEISDAGAKLLKW